ncbi:MAG: hypothetical protein AB3N13_10615 [Arenibacterium sp.]
MPLEFLLVLVIGGISGIALALHMTGHSKIEPMDETTAKAGWLRHYPDDPVMDLFLTPDGRAALVTTATERGVVWQTGADTIARKLADYHLVETRGGLTLRFDDFGAPRLKLKLSETESLSWKRQLS